MTHLSTLSLLFGVLLQCSYMKKTTMQELSTLSLFFFWLQFNTEHKEEDNDNDSLKCVIIIYCFATT
jgi:hypothetical protein